MKLQTMLDEAMNIADFMRQPAHIFEKKPFGYAVVNEATSILLKKNFDYKFVAIVYPKP